MSDRTSRFRAPAMRKRQAPMDLFCNDDVLVCCILRALDPADVAHLAATCKHAQQLCRERLLGLALTRLGAKVQLRRIRRKIEQRSAFVSAAIGVRELSPAAECAAGVAGLLTVSPDPLADLVAAIQKALQLLESQTVVEQPAVARILSDLSHMAALAYLAAWRARMRNREAAIMPPRAPQPAADSEEQGEEAAVPMAEGEGAAAAGEAEAAAAELAPAQISIGVQTDGGGPSLAETRALVDGFRALSSAQNPSMRPCSATLNLVRHFLVLELRTWQPPVMLPGDEPGAAGGVGDEDGGAPEVQLLYPALL